MILFATPDFGASGFVALILFGIGATVFILAALGIAGGAKLQKSASSKARKCGLLLMAVSPLVPVFCCLAPPHAVRLIYGNYPIGSYPSGKIEKGMTFDDVTAILGTPHERVKRDDRESWYYWIDSFGLGYFGVNFGPDGRVTGTHGN